jgi:hypothetical protein
MVLPTYDEMNDTLISDGYYLKDVSPSGSRYYVGLNRPYVRVSDREPNGPTAAWIKRNGVTDHRVAQAWVNLCEIVDEPEVGYHSHPALSRSDIAIFVTDGPAMFKAAVLDKTFQKEDPTKEMMIGSLTHQQALEPHLDSGVVVIPKSALNEQGHRKGKAWQAFEEANQSKCLLKEDEYNDTMRSVVSLRKAMDGLIHAPGAKREHEIYWTHERTGLALRCKLDLLVDMNGTLYVPDIKTCASIKRFKYQVESSALWLQCAHYRTGVRAKYQRESHFWFVLVEKSGLCKVRHREVGDDVIEEADKRYEAVLDDIKARTLSGDWTDPDELETVKLTKRDCFGWEDRE